VSTAVAGVLGNLRREWAANRRLRAGVVVIAGILALYLFLVLQDWRAALAERYADRTAHLYKMMSLAGQDEWIGRAQAVARVRTALEAEIPEAATVGLAQASVQGWMRDLTAAFGSPVQVQAGPPAQSEQDPALWRIPVVLSGAADPPRVLQLAKRIEERKSLAVIEEAVMVNRENRTFSLTVVSYYRVAEVPADAAD
jgi:hypothetical protein